MPTFVGLLRGINLGPHRRLSMDELRRICETLGYTRVRTYVQSGNVVFSTKERNAARVASRLYEAIEESAGFTSDVIIRTREQMEAVVKRNPFASREDVPPDRLLVTFFDRLADGEAIAAVNAMSLPPPEEFRLIAQELYVFYPNGVGRSKFPADRISKALGATGTARNWNTVLKLLEMASEASQS